MTAFLLLFGSIGLLPLLVGLVRARHGSGAFPDFPFAVNAVFCALAFNLTFFWQELWLVLPKALVPGLHPILFHNNHEWTGIAPVAELLQGTGAIATLVSGLAFTALLSRARSSSGTWQLFYFWMAFQGLFQSLTQLAIGTILPGNDVGRALAYLGVGPAGHWALLSFAVVALLLTGTGLARLFPINHDGSRAPAIALLAAALLSVVLIVPFRLPRDPVEVVLIPLVVNITGIGWLTVGLAAKRPSSPTSMLQRPSLMGPTCALVIVLIVFQFVLRPGLRF